jgi:uncharacterized protein YndB with AHSA1/START domain
MSMMTTVQIEREVVIDAPVDVVWRTVTEPEQISQWFADRVELEARPGGRGALIFDHEGGDTVNTVPFVVEAMDAPTRFAFRWNHPEGATPAPGNSVLVEFLLNAEGGERTRLRVKESGLDDLTWPEADKTKYAAEHNEGWGHFFGRIEALVLRG